MKWFPFILAVYFLGLALIACTDGNVLPNLSDNEQIVMVADGHAGHDHVPLSDIDSCSPLCICHCCHIHVTLMDVEVPNSILDHLASSPSYLNQFQETDHFDFFVPPRA